ncbi:MAG: M20 family metallopeptidase [Acidimicrobiia bacterium]|nr:M20 family metallopeptidase [Acidimicrobiia bacterium]
MAGMAVDVEALKDRLCAEVDARGDLLCDVARRIHDRPELCYEEHFAHDLLAGICEQEGLATVRGAAGVDTAFVADAGIGGPMVGVCCEYDALPGLGHACGHNVIAAAGLGAGLAAAAVADEVGGRIRVLGTPAEEGGGGKVHLVDDGLFAPLDAALMVHPASADLTTMAAIANQQVQVTFTGRSSHAAAAPHQGRNALDAAVLAYVNIAALRQHIRPTERVHGIFTHGGDKPNVVPSRAAQHWYVRAADLAALEELKPRVIACLEAGATAAGCGLEIEWIDPAYADMRDNRPLLDLYAANSARIGRTVADPTAHTAVVGSTDMGNVSYAVPSIHPMIAVAPPGTAIHTEAFAEHTRGPAADAAVLDGAKAMAMTIADLWCDPDARAAVRGAFDRRS